MEWWISVIPDPVYRTLAESGIIIIVSFISAWIVSLIMHFIQVKIAARTETDLDDRIIAVVRKSTKRLLVVTGLYIAAHHLENVLEGLWITYADGLFFVIVVLLITILISGVIGEVFLWYLESVAKRTASTVDDEIIPLVKRIVNILLYMIAVITCLDHFHIDIKALIVSLGVGTFAVAFAAQETLANMIAGFVIMVDRPFRVGDRVNLPESNKIGDVIKIGLRSTKILDFDNNIVTIPNAEIVKNDIINYSYPDITTRLKIDLDVAYGSDIEKIKEILVGVVSSFETVLQDPPPAAYFVSFKESGIGMTVIGRVRNYKELWDTLDAARIKIYQEFRTSGVEFPFPQRIVQIREQKVIPAGKE